MQNEQRLAALAVTRVHAGATLPAALAAVDDGAPTRGHALVQELAYGTLRHWGRLSAVTRGARRQAAARCNACRTGRGRALPARSHAGTGVRRRRPRRRRRGAGRASAGQGAGQRAVAPLPARTRRTQSCRRRGEPGRALVVSALVDRQGRGRSPAALAAILAAGNERPPLTLRVNRRATTRDALAAAMADRGRRTRRRSARPASSSTTPRPVTELPGYAEGAFSVQDVGAQLAAPLLDARDGMRVLDACAAPGGKTTHLLGTRRRRACWPLDSDAARLAARPREPRAAAPGGPRRRMAAGDAGAPADWWDGRPFDRILADVPCTASGIVRRHPDIKWLRAQVRRRVLCRPAAAHPGRRCGRCSRRAGGCCTRPARCSRPKTSCRSANSWPNTRRRCAKPSAFRPMCPHDGGQLLPSGKGAGPQSGRFLLRAAPQGLTRLRTPSQPRRPRRRGPQPDCRRHAVRLALRFLSPAARLRRRGVAPPARRAGGGVLARGTGGAARTRSRSRRPSCGSRKARCCSTPSSSSR